MAEHLPLEERERAAGRLLLHVKGAILAARELGLELEAPLAGAGSWLALAQLACKVPHSFPEMALEVVEITGRRLSLQQAVRDLQRTLEGGA